MKHFITFVFCLAITVVFAQNKGINLIKNTSNKTIFLKEYRRIKVKTTDKKAIAGKFTVLNDSTISIKNIIIPIDSIISIRKASTVSTIVRTTSIAVGSTFILIGLGGLVAGPYGYLASAVFTPPGLVFFIVPQTAMKHPVKKWKYEIVNE